MNAGELKVGEMVSVQMAHYQAFQAQIVALFPQFAKVKDNVGVIRRVTYSDIKEKIQPKT
jgi:hypothetical protein